jgi:predicted DCC family thiol-disulfide oxidoreductase YuxK
MRETEATPRPDPVVGRVLYDAACGVCSRWVPFWAPTLRRIGLDVAPLQATWVGERTGRWWAWPLYVLNILPVGRQLFDWGYRTFARRVSAVCGLAPPDPDAR